MDKVKCFWIGRCIFQELTRDGSEHIKCQNIDCPLFSIEKEKEDLEGGKK